MVNMARTWRSFDRSEINGAIFTAWELSKPVALSSVRKSCSANNDSKAKDECLCSPPHKQGPPLMDLPPPYEPRVTDPTHDNHALSIVLTLILAHWENASGLQSQESLALSPHQRKSCVAPEKQLGHFLIFDQCQTVDLKLFVGGGRNGRKKRQFFTSIEMRTLQILPLPTKPSKDSRIVVRLNTKALPAHSTSAILINFLSINEWQQGKDQRQPENHEEPCFLLPSGLCLLSLQFSRLLFMHLAFGHHALSKTSPGLTASQ